MDDFGFLVQQYGIKPQGKSAPMASKKASTNTHDSKTLDRDLDGGSKLVSSPSKSTHDLDFGGKSLLDDHNDQWDAVFQVPTKNYYVPVTSSASNSGGTGRGFRLDSLFNVWTDSKSESSASLKGNRPAIADDYDDIFGGFSGAKTLASFNMDDSLSSAAKVSDPTGDIWGILGTMESMPSMGSSQNSSRDLKEDELDTDDLIPVFGDSVVGNDRGRIVTSLAKRSAGVSLIEELDDFVVERKQKNADGSVEEAVNMGNKQGLLEGDLIDIVERSGSGSAHEGDEEAFTSKENGDKLKNQNCVEVDLDSFFSGHSRTSTAPPWETSGGNVKAPVPDLFPQSSSSVDKHLAGASFFDNLSLVFEAALPSEGFEEVEGESKERRKARFERYQKKEARVAQALADMNQRDFQVQLDQEERCRLAESVDMKMKQWAAGKEGNLRTLLSSLQQVLWPECGWKPVSLADLITSSQVKMVYRRAALCVHPDKVQQRGANIQQRYIAEKVFDLLKEAWKKFSSEELR
ncbi:hypothetical protein Dimus_005283 [Dionaea muscipula]